MLGRSGIPTPKKTLAGFFLFFLFLPPSTAVAVPTLAEAVGKIMLMPSGQNDWRPVAQGAPLSAGDQLHTYPRAKAVLAFDDGSRIELGPESTFTIDDASSQGPSMHLGLGSLRAFIKHLVGQRFEVRTPTAVCSVRGTEFLVVVNSQGHTAVQMFSGILAVGDNRGNEVLIRDRDRIRVTDKGLSPVDRQTKNEPLQARLKDLARREVGLEMSKEQVQAAAAQELMNAVYKEGKAIIDVNGQRVRIEEYIVRPAANAFKLVVLDERANRFDYFYYHGVFNQTLPSDLSVALRQLPGCIGSPCRYFLSSYDTGRSNTQDNMLEVASGGHRVDVNNDGVANDAVTAAFDPATNSFVGLAPGQPFWQTLYNNNTLTFNGVPHNGWTPIAGANAAPNAHNMCDTGGVCIDNMGGQINTATVLIAGVPVTPTTLTTIQQPPTCAPPNCTYQEAGLEHQVVYSANNNGQWDKFDSYIISDAGKVATTGDFAGATNGASYKQTLLQWNFEQIVTASEFAGRSIDLAVAPKMFIQSGLIP